MTYEQWKEEQIEAQRRKREEIISLATEEYEKLEQIGLPRLLELDIFAEMRYNNTIEYSKIKKRHKNLVGEGRWEAVEFNPETLSSHYSRHGHGVDAASSKEYGEKALNFVNGSRAKESIIRDDGCRSFYSTKDNLFAVVYSDGTISTFYKPKTGIKYWEGQKKKYGK